MAVALAVVLAVISRLAEWPVPYIFGLIATFAVAERQSRDRDEDSLPTLCGGVFVLGVSMLLWQVSEQWMIAGRTAAPGSWNYHIAYAIGLVVVAGVQAVVFGLVPLKPLDGHIGG